jgi:hypothetical protein
MEWFFRRSAARRSAKENGVHLQLEALEERCVPTVTYHGGDLLTHVEAQAVFYGNGWNSTNASTRTTLNNFLGYIVNSPYTEALTRAGYGVGSGTATTGVLDAASLPTTVTDSAIRSELQSLISHATVATPDANRLYVFFVAPNEIVSEGNLTSMRGLLGYHGAFAGRTAGGQSVDVHYVVVAYPGGTVHNSTNSVNAIDDLTSVASHELAEAITDPNVNYKTLGWYDNQRGEIGDITQSSLTHLNGYLVQQVAGTNDQPLSLTNFAGLPGTTTTVSASSNHVRPGQQMTLTIHVSPNSGTAAATGTITLLDGDKIIGTVTLGANGTAVVSLFAPVGSNGTHTITAIYSGNNSYLDSFASSFVLTVG